ncbi:MAG: hypothetical protein HOP15_13065 [Planctomycetes bacterium]|nr:hypothetical protein [Planctomycetota bacterium]
MANDLGLSSVLLCSVLLIAASPFFAAAAGGVPAKAPAQQPAQKPLPAEGELEAALVAAGLTLDRAAGVLSLPASVRVKNDLLEYLLVGPHGAAHESLFLTTVRPSLINAGLLLLGAEPGVNAYPEDLGLRFEGNTDERGRTERRVHPPAGDGFFLYAGWREQGESYFFRIEDLLRNLASGRSLRRHRWVYLGSRFAALKPGASKSFLADVEGNLINLSFFYQGNTLLTAALPECAEQTIWAANEWLLPPMDAPVRLFFARAPLETLTDELRASLPEVLGEAPPEAQPPENGR